MLIASLGLEYTTKKDWYVRSIDIHVKGAPRGWEAPNEERIDEWEMIKNMMENLD